MNVNICKPYIWTAHLRMKVYMYAIIVAVDTTEGNSLVKEPTIDFRWNLVCWCFHATDADKYGYYSDFWWSLCATNKCDYFPMRRVLSHRVRLSLIVYSSTCTSQKKSLQIPCIINQYFYPLKETSFGLALLGPLHFYLQHLFHLPKK